MVLGEFEPDVWIPSSHAAARRGAISLEELAGLDVIHGPRRAQPATYDAWTKVLQEVNPRFQFTDPPFRRSLPMTLSLAATGDRPTAVLTGPATPARAATPIQRPRSADRSGMVRVSLTRRPLSASAALVWSGDLPRALQQMLFETADALAPPASAQPAELACLRFILVSTAAFFFSVRTGRGACYRDAIRASAEATQAADSAA